MNKAILMGNITQDMELKQTPNGHSVLNFSIATNSQIKNGDNWEDKVEFHNLTAWGKIADNIAKFFSKGSKILIEGQIETRSWDDKEGNKRYKTEIIVRNFEFTGSKSNLEGGVKVTNKPEKKVTEEISIEDIPF